MISLLSAAFNQLCYPSTRVKTPCKRKMYLKFFLITIVLVLSIVLPEISAEDGCKKNKFDYDCKKYCKGQGYFTGKCKRYECKCFPSSQATGGS